VEYKKALKEAKKTGTHLDLFDFECDKLNSIHNAVTGQRGINASSENDDLSLLEFIEQECFDCPSTSVHSSETMVAYGEALATLDRRESFVIAEYYGLTGNDTKSLREIDLDGLSQEMINRIRKKALERMKKHHRLRELMSA
jgi:DNA-directed RNA polymerase sigma subunit (sigma70/sigma32)